PPPLPTNIPGSAPICWHQTGGRSALHHPSSGSGSSGAIDVGSMVDGQDDNAPILVVDGVEDAVVAPVGAMGSFELEAEGSPDPVRIVGHGAVDELNRGSGHLFGKALESSLGGGGPFDGVGPLLPGHRRLISAS